MNIEQKIKTLLCEQSFNWITKDKAWRFFKRSEYFNYFKQDIKGNTEELSNCARYYAEKFSSNIRYLNLF